MKALLVILVAAALVFGVYHYSFRAMPVTDKGTAPTQAIALTAVRTDLLQIAQAERGYIVLNGSCVSLEELISSSALPVPHTRREGYAYSVECSGTDFGVTARHAPAPEGSPIRYPNFAIDANMQISEIQ
jgi:hypothetical protein